MPLDRLLVNKKKELSPILLIMGVVFASAGITQDMRKRTIQYISLHGIAMWVMLLGSSVATAAGVKPLDFTSSIGMPFSNAQHTGFEDRLITEICHRIGRKVSIHFEPSKRALRDLDEGDDDGTLARAKIVKRKYPELVIVQEPAFMQQFVAFSIHDQFRTDSWLSLTPYNIGFVVGWRILEKHIKDCKSLVETNSGKQLFRTLEHDRIDVAVYNRWSGVYLSEKLKIRGVHVLLPPLARAPIYFLLAKKDAHLAELMSQALRDMKKDGTYKKIYDQTMKQYLQ